MQMKSVTNRTRRTCSLIEDWTSSENNKMQILYSDDMDTTSRIPLYYRYTIGILYLYLYMTAVMTEAACKHWRADERGNSAAVQSPTFFFNKQGTQVLLTFSVLHRVDTESTNSIAIRILWHRMQATIFSIQYTRLSATHFATNHWTAWHVTYCYWRMPRYLVNLCCISFIILWTL